jgi:type I restriction enzyme S subunit
VIRPNRSIVLDNWLIYYLNISDLTEHITGMTVPKLNQGKLREIKIPIAPLNQQQDILDMLDSISQNTALIEENCRCKIVSLIELKQSILKEAFSGKLTGGIAA